MLLSSLPRCWDYRHGSPVLVYTVLDWAKGFLHACWEGTLPNGLHPQLLNRLSIRVALGLHKITQNIELSCLFIHLPTIPFINRYFYWNIWEFHIMSPDHSYFSILLGLPPPWWPPLPPKKVFKQSNLSICAVYIVTGAGQTPGGQPFKEKWGPPLPVAICCAELHFSILTAIFKSCLQWLPV